MCHIPLSRGLSPKDSIGLLYQPKHFQAKFENVHDEI